MGSSAPAASACRPFAPRKPSRSLPSGSNQSAQDSCFRIKLSTLFNELSRLLLHSCLNSFCLIYPLHCRIFPHIFSYLHGAKVRTTHAAEVSRFCSLLGQCFIMKL